MQKVGVLPTPHNYEVFYTFHAGTSPELSKALTALIGGGNVSASDIEDLYTRFLASKALTDSLATLSERLGEQMAASKGLTERAAQNSKALGDSMTRFLQSLQNSKDPDLIVKSLDFIVNEATAAEKANNSITGEFASTQGAYATLHAELAEARRDSLTDALTALGNRRAFDKSLEACVEQARADGQPLSLCMLDLDHFKRFNDKHGHTTGDSALRLVARIIKDNVRESDVIARYGGEEFGIIMPNTKAREALVLVERVRSALEKRPLVKKATGEQLGNITASFGVAQLQPKDDMDSLLERADVNLYAAKRAGRNQVEVGMDDAEQVSDIVDSVKRVTSRISSEPKLR